MKRSFYIVGIILILALIAVWLFLLFASEDTKTDVYNRFGISGSPEEGIFEEVIDAIIPDVFQKQYLRQLTTKRVIGYTEVVTASSTLMYFVEGGTGHVFTIDPMIEGSENRVSNVTIPVATRAAISVGGTYIAIRSGNQPEANLTVLTRNGEAVDTYTLEEPVRDFTINSNNDVLYTIAGGSGLYGKSLDLETKTTKTIFEIPFREATIVWGSGPDDSHYVYPKTSRYLEGYLYEIKAGKFTRLPVSGFGFMANGNKDFVAYSVLENDKYTSSLLNNEFNTSRSLPLNFVPEKCTFGAAALFCASSDTSGDYRFPDNWYRGEISFADTIWKVYPETFGLEIVVDTLGESGRELDIVSPEVGTNDSFLYFINKNDQSLWTYEFEVLTNSSEWYEKNTFFCYNHPYFRTGYYFCPTIFSWLAYRHKR